MRTSVAFLVINKIEELPRIAIQSVLDNSDSDIFVGYLNAEDVSGLDLSPRVNFIQLQPLPNLTINGEYRDFSEDLFYQIVQLKWQLLAHLLETDVELVIYTDLDVIWLRNPIETLIGTFNKDEQLSVQIQSFTTDPDDPKLCMGFVALKNNAFSRKAIADCRILHENLSNADSRVGDDDVITQYFKDMTLVRQIHQLPQPTFPVGSLLNLYSTRAKFPGLTAPRPYIFHLNYVVGLANKRLMLRVLNKALGLNLELRGIPHWRLIIIIKRIRFHVRNLIKAFMS